MHLWGLLCFRQDERSYFILVWVSVLFIALHAFISRIFFCMNFIYCVRGVFILESVRCYLVYLFQSCVRNITVFILCIIYPPHWLSTNHPSSSTLSLYPCPSSTFSSSPKVPSFTIATYSKTAWHSFTIPNDYCNFSLLQSYF